MLVHACSLSTQEVEAEDYELETNPKYIIRPCLKKNPLAVEFSGRVPT